MVVVMKEKAARHAGGGGHRPPRRARHGRASLDRRVAHRARRGRQRQGRSAADRADGRRARGAAHHEPYKLASRTFKPEDTVFTIGDVRIGGDEVIVMAGPCSAESEAQVHATAAAVKRAGAKVLRGGAFKPRSLAVQLPGHGRGGPAAAARRRQRARPEARHRGDGHQPDRGDRQVRRHLPGRRAQHAELHAAPRARPHAQADPAEARHLRDDGGVAAVGGIHPLGRQQGRDPLRARHPHVRNLHAQHARHLGDSGRQGAVAPAGLRRSRATARAAATRSRRWRARRSPPAPTA